MIRGIDTASLAWKAGAISGALGVALGAFGAHGLQNRVKEPRMLDIWKTAAQYQLVHSVALLASAAHPRATASYLFITGQVLFSGSLYALVLSEQKWLGAITPIGGLAYIGGWLLLLL